MPAKIVKNDITKIECYTTTVNVENPSMLRGGEMIEIYIKLLEISFLNA